MIEKAPKLRTKKRDRINIAIHWHIGNLKNTHVGDHRREGPYIGAPMHGYSIHWNASYPYIGTLSIHRYIIHTSKLSIHRSSDVWIASIPMYGWSIQWNVVHTSEDGLYIGTAMYGPSSDVWLRFYAPTFNLFWILRKLPSLHATLCNLFQFEHGKSVCFVFD